MGNQMSPQQFIWNQEFEIVDQETPDLLILVNKTTQQQYLGCRKSCSDVQVYKQIAEIVDCRISHSSPYVVDLQRAVSHKNEYYCSQLNTFYLLFRKPPQTLKINSMNRKFRNQIYSEEEGSVLLQTGIRGLMYLQDLGHTYHQLSMNSIYLMKDNSLILGDPFMNNWSAATTYPYPSPEEIIYKQKQSNLDIDLHASALFSLAVIILELLNLQHMDILYQKAYSAVRWKTLNYYLNSIKNQQLKKGLNTILQQQPKKRKHIYNLYKGTPNSTYQFTTKARQKFLFMMYNNYPNHVKQQYEPSNTQVTTNNTQCQKSSFIKKQPNIVQSTKHVINRQICNNNNFMIKQSTKQIPSIVYHRQNYLSTYDPTTQLNSKSNKTPIRIQYVNNAQNNTKDMNLVRFSNQQRNMQVKTIPLNHHLPELELKNDKKQSIIDMIQDLSQPEQSNISFNKIQSNCSNQTNKEKIVSYKSQQNFCYEQKVKNIHSQTYLNIDSIPIMALSNNSDSSLLETINQVQIQKTPNRLTKKGKYNSTIKQVTQVSASASSDLESEDTVQYQAGTRYKGELKEGVRNGYGILYYKDGSRYQGEWKNNKMHGKGKLYYANGSLAYEGDWFMDDFHGKGIIFNKQNTPLSKTFNYHDFSQIYQSWQLYEGQLAMDRRHGKGKLQLSNGQTLIGNFEHNMVHGEGIFHGLNGVIVKGIWKNNKLSKQIIN